MIKIRDLKYRYAESTTYALNGINLELSRGQFIAILGHNGSGKSTLSKVLVGLNKPESGEVFIDDILLSKENIPLIRDKIGMVFQNPENQFIGSTVESDIAFGLENKQMSREEMKKLVHFYADKVDMLSNLDKQPQFLSGGQKQRVAIASTLALDPEIIIFDEVTSMLDPKGKTDVLNIIKSIKNERKKTLISITHDMDEAILADTCVVLAAGEVIAVGTPKEILANKDIVKRARIDAPFVYRVSEMLKTVKPTFDEDELVEAICK